MSPLDLLKRITRLGNGSGSQDGNGGIRFRAGDNNPSAAYEGRGLDRRANDTTLSRDQRKIDPTKPLVNLISEHYGNLCTYYDEQGNREIHVTGTEKMSSFNDLREQYIIPLVKDLFVRDGQFNRLEPLSVDQLVEAWEKVKTALPYSREPRALAESQTPLSSHDYSSINPTRARLGNIITLWYGLQADGVTVRKEDLDALIAGTKQLMQGESDGVKPFIPYLTAFPQIRTRIREAYKGITERIPRDDEANAHSLFETRQNLFDSILHAELMKIGYNFISDNPLLNIVKEHADSFKAYIAAHHELYSRATATNKETPDSSYTADVIALRKRFLEGFVRDLYVANDGKFNNGLRFNAFDLAETWHELCTLMPYSNGKDGKPRLVIAPAVHMIDDTALIEICEPTNADYNVVNDTRKEIAAMLLLRAGLQGVDIKQEDLNDIVVGSFCLGNKKGVLPDGIRNYFASQEMELDTERVLGLTPLYGYLFEDDPRKSIAEPTLSQTGREIVDRMNTLYTDISKHSHTTIKNGLIGLPPEIRENFSQLPIILGYYGIKVTGKAPQPELVGIGKVE